MVAVRHTARFFQHFFTIMTEETCMENKKSLPGISFVTGFFWGIVVLAVALALLIFFLSAGTFLAYSNYLQIITAFAGGAALLALWHPSRDRKSLLWIAAGFLLWGLSNIGWYVNALMGLRTQSFPAIFDAGLVLSLFIMGYALWNGLLGKKISTPALSALLVACLIIPAWIVVVSGISMAALATLGYFLACGLLIAGGLDLSPGRQPLVTIGAFLLALAFMIYPLREMYMVSSPILSVVGPVVCAGLALIVLGLFTGSSGPATPA